MRDFCSLVLFFVITTTVNCSLTPKRHADYRSPLSRLSLTKVGRTDLLITARQGNYTLDRCENDLDCQDPRSCRKSSNLTLSCLGDDSCSCFPSEGSLVFCTNQEKCETGETCATSGVDLIPNPPACVSSEVAKARGLTVVDEPPGNGLTRDLCSDAEDCEGERICRYAFNVDQLCNDRDPCICLWPVGRPNSCCTDTDCESPEVCAENTDLNENNTFCVSQLSVDREKNWKPSQCTSPPVPSPTRSPGPTRNRTPSPSNSPASSSASPSPISSPTSIPPSPAPIQLPPPPCIAVHQLHHLPESQLVFQRHPWSKVLCDAQTSCATAGHMVIYQNQPMMMSTYCKIVGCVTRVMQVNSPRYRRKLSVPSMTDELEFTSFAARYETSLEQYLFTLAVRIGL